MQKVERCLQSAVKEKRDLQQSFFSPRLIYFMFFYHRQVLFRSLILPDMFQRNPFTCLLTAEVPFLLSIPLGDGEEDKNEINLLKSQLAYLDLIYCILIWSRRCLSEWLRCPSGLSWKCSESCPILMIPPHERLKKNPFQHLLGSHAGWGNEKATYLVYMTINLNFAVEIGFPN